MINLGSVFNFVVFLILLISYMKYNFIFYY